jgi:hypothetical protein
MKTSQNRKSWLRGSAALVLAASVAFGAAAPALADTTTTTTPQYQPWAGAAGQQLKSLIADLKAKIAAAEQSQAASPDFLADLKALVAKYEALQTSGAQTAGTGTTTGPAAGSVVFSDNFADGDFTANPTWKVSAGTWSVDPNGTNRGLMSKIRPQKVNLNAVLGALLNSQANTAAQDEFASIYTKAAVPNAFALQVVLTSKDKQGALNLGVYQGASGTTLYRMVYQPGATPGLAIQKVTAQGVTTLGQSSGGANLEDGNPHTLLFSRDGQGAMTLSLDGKSVATAKDTSIQGAMTGLLFVNSGGAYYIREVKVTAN